MQGKFAEWRQKLEAAVLLEMRRPVKPKP